MGDNEIIKALELCVNNGYPYGCKDCPYHNLDCNDGLDADALGLINRQKAEFEWLNMANTSVVEHLKKSRRQLKTAKAEAVKEFADRLLFEFRAGVFGYSHIRYIINNLVIEMVGDAY